jgi:hypothetical protein
MHLLKERTQRFVTTKCGQTFATTWDTTAWWTDVTCPDCIERMNLARFATPAPDPAPARRRIVRRRREG